MSFLYSIPGVRLAQTKLNQLTSYIPPPPPEKTGKRRVLLVHSHPSSDSYSSAIANVFEKSAIEQGHDVKRISLYEHDNPNNCYRPNLSRKERASYFSFIGKDMDSKTERKMLDPQVKTHLDLLRWCDTLVLVYPTWWMNTPASLKGFFDRTLVAGLTWEFPNKHNNSSGAKLGLVPKLTNIERIVGISTYGAKQAIVQLAGDNGRRMISNAVRHSVCPGATVTWLGLYNVDTMPAAGRTKFLEQVAQLPKQM